MGVHFFCWKNAKLGGGGGSEGGLEKDHTFSGFFLCTLPLRYLESKKGTTDTQIYLYFRRVKYFLRELPRKEALTNLEMDWLQFLHMVQRILPYGGQWAKTQTVHQKCGNSEKNTITSTTMFSDSEKVQKVEQIKSHKWTPEKAFTSTRKLGWTHLR